MAASRTYRTQLASLDAPHLDLIVAAYVFKLLSHIGYLPDCSSCVACEDEAPTYFSAHAGGLLCASCASSVAGSEALELGEPAWLASLISMRFDELAATPIDPYTAARLLGFSHVWAATHLEALELGEPAWLASLISMRFDELAATPIDPYTAARLLGFSHVWAATHLDCRLRAFEFLLGR